MQLEQTLEKYQPLISQKRQTTYLVVGDLENLSASALYSEKPYIKDFSDGIPIYSISIGKARRG